MVKPSQEDEFFLHDYEFFSKFLLLSVYIKTLLKVSDPIFEKNPEPVNNLKI